MRSRTRLKERGREMFQASNAYQVYQNNHVNTSSKGKLLLMLYDGALKFLRFAVTAMEEKNIEGANRYLLKTQNILHELMSTLDFNIDLSEQLYSLYDYMNQELVNANIAKDPLRVKTVYSMLEELRETWAKII